LPLTALIVGTLRCDISSIQETSDQNDWVTMILISYGRRFSFAKSSCRSDLGN